MRPANYRRIAAIAEYSDIAVVPIATELASRQLVVTEPFSAKVSDDHDGSKTEERLIRTDRTSAGVQVAQLDRQARPTNVLRRTAQHLCEWSPGP